MIGGSDFAKNSNAMVIKRFWCRLLRSGKRRTARSRVYSPCTGEARSLLTARAVAAVAMGSLDPRVRARRALPRDTRSSAQSLAEARASPEEEEGSSPGEVAAEAEGEEAVE